MRELSNSTNKNQVTVAIAKILRRDDYLELWGPTPANLEVHLYKNKDSGTGHNGTGRFTVAIPSVAFQFLQEYGGRYPRKTVQLAGKRVLFMPSRDRPRKDIVQKLLRIPYVDPYMQAKKQKKIAEAKANRIPISGIEFGRLCRDNVFSCEWERLLVPSGSLSYDEDRREFRISFGSKSIAIRSAQINRASCGMVDHLPVIYFNLESHPIFEETVTPPSPFSRTRISSLDLDHERVVAYASLALRCTCNSPGSLEMFHTLCRISPLKKASDSIYHKEHRQLFSAERITRFELWLAQLDFEVAFQVEKIVRDAEVDLQEILDLQQDVGDFVRSKGAKHTVDVLRSFQSALKETTWDAHLDMPTLFRMAAREYVPEIKSLGNMAFEDTFTCYHVSVTPTAMKLSGPFQERSNRVFRRYPDRHSCFIRVTFEEETRLQLRFDREVDGAAFVKRRYGTILRKTGLEICGQRYLFLAYSQSALKEHSVWFMRPFTNKDGVWVNPAFIIDSLGDFDNAPDSKLIYCPGRYGARISQSFTSTDSGVSVQPEEIQQVRDIEISKVPGDPSSGKWNFTDGVGTISPDLAKQIWDTICARRQSAKRVRIYPKCFQIRFQGCKVCTLFLISLRTPCQYNSIEREWSVSITANQDVDSSFVLR